MSLLHRSVKSLSLRHSNSRTSESVRMSPLMAPVVCRATSGAQSPSVGRLDRAPPDDERAEGKREHGKRGPAPSREQCNSGRRAEDCEQGRGGRSRPFRPWKPEPERERRPRAEERDGQKQNHNRHDRRSDPPCPRAHARVSGCNIHTSLSAGAPLGKRRRGGPVAGVVALHTPPWNLCAWRGSRGDRRRRICRSRAILSASLSARLSPCI